MSIFHKKPEKPKTDIDKLSEKVDQTVAKTQKDLKEISHPARSKRGMNTDDAIVDIKSDLDTIKKT